MNFASMTLGQYIPRDSVIHKLNPQAKLFSVLSLVTAAWLSNTGTALACCILLLLTLIYSAKFSWRTIARSCRPLAFLVMFTFLLNFIVLLYSKHDVGLALSQAAFTAFRLLVLMTFAILLPLTTAPLELADGIENLLSPLARFKFPAHECAMMIGLTLRFIPLLVEETNKIIKAQLSRGAQLDQGGLFQRVRAFVPVFIPLFLLIFRRADELALAMEARGYSGGKGRTRRCPLHWRRTDTCAIIFSLGFCIMMFLLRSRL